MLNRIFVASCLLCVSSLGCSGSDSTQEEGAPVLEGTPVLEEKLDHVFSLYQEASQQIRQDPWLGTSTEEDAWAKWQDLLAPATTHQLSAEDVNELRQQQQQRIEESRLAAIQISADLPVNFEDVRAAERVEELCQQIPKGAMTHIHETGAAHPEALSAMLMLSDGNVEGARLAEIAGLATDEADFLRTLPEVPFRELSEEQKARFMALYELKVPRSFTRFIWSFKAIIPLMLEYKEEQLRFLYADFLKRAEQQNVPYVEIMTHFDSVDEDLVRTLNERKAQWSSVAPTIQVNWLAEFYRFQPAADIAAQAIKLFDEASALPNSPVVGLELVSDETHFPAFEKGRLYYPELASRDSGMGLAMHAGELGRGSNPRDAALLGATRLGHGVRLQDDPVTMEYFSRYPVVSIDINLTSNYVLEVIDDYQAHPFLKFHRLGIPIAFSTDDEGMLGPTDISQECVKALNFSDITYSEWKDIAFKSIEATFASPAQKSELREQMETRFQAFEQAWTTSAA